MFILSVLTEHKNDDDKCMNMGEHTNILILIKGKQIKNGNNVILVRNDVQQNQQQMLDFQVNAIISNGRVSCTCCHIR